MRYPAEETAEKHQKILNEAARMFREEGLTNVSVGSLMQAAGLTHGSFYNHFSSKQAIISECIKMLSGSAVTRISAWEPSEKGKSDFVAAYTSEEARDDPGDNCPMPALGAEIAREPSAKPAMTAYVQTFFKTLITHFPWSSRTRARREAIQMTASLVGAVVLARSVDDIGLSTEILQEVARQYNGSKMPSKAKQ